MAISRRNFIKASAVGAVTLGAAGSLLSAEKWFRPAQAANEAQAGLASSASSYSAARGKNSFAPFREKDGSTADRYIDTQRTKILLYLLACSA